ncbi:MAG: sugar transferase [Gemmatimonadetes bacterium]|nr:sugar transferase [Gemmatimonadota bacterium]
MQLDPAMLERVGKPQDYEAPAVTRLNTTVPFYRHVTPVERLIKRTMDVVCSAVALLIFGLFLPFIALAIKLDSRGPVFYSQTRVGINRRAGDRRRHLISGEKPGRRNAQQSRDRRKIVAEGRHFEILKLRTMRVNSESEGVRWAEKNDPRITRVGKLLRLTRLDEFPQFWNVLKGDMSIVGPRPERPPFITLLSGEVPGYLHRLRFKPGITGLAQIEIGYDQSIASVHRKVELDLKYITRFSLWLDIKILFRSVKVVLTGQGAC